MFDGREDLCGGKNVGEVSSCDSGEIITWECCGLGGGMWEVSRVGDGKTIPGKGSTKSSVLWVK